jgi:hypothetical protein
MFANDSLSIGIDPTAGSRPLTYAALDDGLRLVALARAEFNDVLAFIAGQRQALIAVSGPPRPNQKVMESPQVRESLTPPPRPGRWADFRLVEYLLRQRRIRSPKTPSAESACPAWMKRSFQVYHRLESLGCTPYPGETPLQWVEVYPHACYSVLLGRKPFAKNTFEGRVQRQLVLYDCNLAIHDAMQVFEEITRHRLLQGILPDAGLYTPVELDALVAAYTAWLAAHRPQDTLLLGDPVEGQILLPAGALKNRY